MRWLVFAVAVMACGGGGANECVSLGGTTRGGSVELGTGISGFTPMGENLQFVLGNQGGTFLILHAKIRGLTPGDPTLPVDPAAPTTHFSVRLADGQVVEEQCPTQLAYEDAGDGSATLLRPLLLPFLPLSLGQGAFDTDITVSVDVVDVMHRMAHAEAVVHAQAPPELGGPDAPPYVDASIPIPDGPFPDAQALDAL